MSRRFDYHKIIVLGVGVDLYSFFNFSLLRVYFTPSAMVSGNNISTYGHHILGDFLAQDSIALTCAVRRQGGFKRNSCQYTVILETRM